MDTTLLHDLLRASLVEEYGERLAAAYLETLAYGTARELAELYAWEDGLVTSDPNPVVVPFRRGSDSATRAGTLSRGQWRGIPVMPRGVIQTAPGDSYYAPGDGKARIRAMAAEFRANAQARAEKARGQRADAQARRAEHTARVGTFTSCGGYCSGYRPARKR